MNSPSSPDDEHTVIRTGGVRTTASGGAPDSDFAPSSTYWGTSLPEGLRLGEYEIKSVIGEGGFGIVYLAWDHFLQRQVALKEYMPSSLAARARSGLEVVVKSERHRDTFLAGLRSFVNEARLLAQFDHPSLVKVYRFWEAHGTAYMVMPYVVGPTLKNALAQLGKPPSEAWLRDSLLHPLLGAIGLLHKAQCLHRDIAPDNILLTETGPLLLDFGAARQIIGDLSQTLTVVLKPGYAPIEQYGEVDSMAQGPWTDVYALAGVVRYAITGKVPPSATTRLINDTMPPLAQALQGRYSDSFLQAVDAALSVRPEHRPQNVWEFQALLDDGLEAEPTTMSPSLPVPLDDDANGSPAWPGTGPRTGTGRGTTTSGRTAWRTTTSPATLGGAVEAQHGGGRTVAGASASPAPAPASAMPLPAPAEGGPVVGTAATADGRAPTQNAGGRAALIGAGAAALLLALAAGGWWMVNGRAPDAGPMVDATSPSPSSTPSTEGTGAGTITPAPAAPPQGSAPPTSPAAEPTPQPAPPVPPPAPTAPIAGAADGRSGSMSAPQPDAAATAVPSPAAPRVETVRPPPSPRPATPASPAPRPAGAMATGGPPREAAAPAPSPARVDTGGNRAARCSDILQKASLEPLSPSETAFLRSECK